MAIVLAGAFECPFWVDCVEKLPLEVVTVV